MSAAADKLIDANDSYSARSAPIARARTARHRALYCITAIFTAAAAVLLGAAVQVALRPLLPAYGLHYAPKGGEPPPSDAPPIPPPSMSPPLFFSGVDRPPAHATEEEAVANATEQPPAAQSPAEQPPAEQTSALKLAAAHDSESADLETSDATRAARLGGGRRSLQGNNCNYASDGDCDDGGPGAEYASCDYGSDCTGASPRQDDLDACAHPPHTCRGPPPP